MGPNVSNSTKSPVILHGLGIALCSPIDKSLEKKEKGLQLRGAPEANAPTIKKENRFIDENTERVTHNVGSRDINLTDNNGV
jgi:hypothetical protein